MLREVERLHTLLCFHIYLLFLIHVDAQALSFQRVVDSDSHLCGRDHADDIRYSSNSLEHPENSLTERHAFVRVLKQVIESGFDVESVHLESKIRDVRDGVDGRELVE